MKDLQSRRVERIETLVDIELPELYEKITALVDNLATNGFERKKSGDYFKVRDPDGYTNDLYFICYVEEDLDRKGRYLLLYGILDRGIMSSCMLKCGNMKQIQEYVHQKEQVVEKCREMLITIMSRREDNSEDDL